MTPTETPTTEAPPARLPADTPERRRGLRQILPIAAIVGLAALAAVFVLRDEPAAAEGDEEQAVVADYPRGPHNGRLLQPEAKGGLAVEVTIAEEGIEPEFRMYPFVGGRPVPPGGVQMTAVVTRLGSVDTVAFRPSGDFLQSTSTVTEPHSFSVAVTAVYKGRTSQWTYESFEGRATMGDDLVQQAGIEVERAGPATILEALRLPGEVAINAEREAHVVPRFSGVVTSVTASQGDVVRAGQVLAVVESRELAGVAEEYVDAAHRLHYVETVFARERQLHERRISATREFDAARHELEEAQIAVQVAEQKLTAAGIPVGRVRALDSEPTGRRAATLGSITRFEVRAPIAGQIIARDVTLGESVSGAASLFTIADLSTVWVEVTVYARDLTSVRPGQAVVVRSPDTELEAQGTIRFVSPVVGADTRAARARVVIPNPGGRWRPGQSVEVDVVRARYEVPLAVRTSSIQDFRDFRVVYARHDGQFEVRMLELGVSDSTWTEVLGGLRVGEPYAATNSFIVKAEIGKAGATHDH